MVYWDDGKLSLELARTWNDGAIAAHQAHPDRFVVLATLPMLDPDRAVDELNRVSKLPGVRGIYIGTNIDGRDLDDPLFETHLYAHRGARPAGFPAPFWRQVWAASACSLILSRIWWPFPWTPRLLPAT